MEQETNPWPRLSVWSIMILVTFWARINFHPRMLMSSSNNSQRTLAAHSVIDSSLMQRTVHAREVWFSYQSKFRQSDDSEKTLMKVSILTKVKNSICILNSVCMFLQPGARVICLHVCLWLELVHSSWFVTRWQNQSLSTLSLFHISNVMTAKDSVFFGNR